MAQHRFNNKSSVDLFLKVCPPAVRRSLFETCRREKMKSRKDFIWLRNWLRAFKTLPANCLLVANYLSYHKIFLLLPSSGPLCVPLMRLMLITVPCSLQSARLSDRSWVMRWEPRDINQSVPLMSGRWALLVCIYVCKLPSAVHIPKDRRWNKRKSQKFHLK